MTYRFGETWALVPVKRFDRAKARLSGLLGPSERAALAEAMLGDVLDALARTPGIAGVLVVSGSIRARELALEAGAEIDDDPLESGVNEAVDRGLRRLESMAISAVVVTPSDLPFATSAEFAAVLAALDRAPVVLAPAARDGGTNILAMAPPGALAPSFGPDSFARHLASAQAIGLRLAVLTLAGAGHDIDVPADLDSSAAPGAGARTRACLAGFAARITGRLSKRASMR